ncbi:DUF4123 domain-containing protein [Chitinolyticbacter albus]|uniref:DUF4123 domain-containing protein n=1 Tax=Chitinolyticbacter albus TaxID=2961951 RepID=UPI00210E9A3B|nr:DUF4123 domain-containing protein [Chitinolyticbacter albus]
MRIDPYAPSAQQELWSDWQVAAATQSGLQLYALLDHAFHRAKKNSLTHLGQWHSLYAGQPGATPDISPLLQRVAQADEPLLSLVSQLLERTQGQPSLSFIASAQPLERLQQHFSHYVDVVILPEKTRYLLRYADTRILPQLLLTLDEEQHAELLAPIHTWCYFDRKGQLQTINGLNQDKIARQTPILSARQFYALLDSSYPDTLANSLREMHSLAGYLPIQPSSLHALSQRLYQAALGQNLLEHPDILGYAVSCIAPAHADSSDSMNGSQEHHA